MPRRGRGQRTNGSPTPGGRTDLNQANIVPTGLPYGEHQALQQAQTQVPLPSTPAPPQAPVGGPLNEQHPLVQAAQQGPSAGPDGQGTLTAPTARPGEPVMAGASPQPDDIVSKLRGIYAANPTEDLRRLLAAAQQRSISQ